jgi:hypothetical protein
MLPDDVPICSVYLDFLEASLAYMHLFAEQPLLMLPDALGQVVMRVVQQQQACWAPACALSCRMTVIKLAHHTRGTSTSARLPAATLLPHRPMATVAPTGVC